MNHNLMLRDGRAWTRVPPETSVSKRKKGHQTLIVFQNALIIYKNLEEAKKNFSSMKPVFNSTNRNTKTKKEKAKKYIQSVPKYT